MKQDFNQFKELPAGERVIWQGKPSFKGLALRSFHVREVAIYFGLLLIWKSWSNWSNGVSAAEMLKSALWLIAPAVSAIVVLAGLAWLFRRAACYTITSKRILFQFGAALPMTMNIPLSKVANAALKTYSDGSGDIPLKLNDKDRVSYLLLWPHIRPWRLRATEPMLNSIPDAAGVAAKLAAALTGQPGPAAISLVSAGGADPTSNAFDNSSPATVAA